jgi:hypothetical protein
LLATSPSRWQYAFFYLSETTHPVGTLNGLLKVADILCIPIITGFLVAIKEVLRVSSFSRLFSVETVTFIDDSPNNIFNESNEDAFDESKGSRRCEGAIDLLIVLSLFSHKLKIENECYVNFPHHRLC